MRRRVRRQSYVDRDLNQRARAHATANRVTDSFVTEAALIKYLDARRIDDGRTTGLPSPAFEEGVLVRREQLSVTRWHPSAPCSTPRNIARKSVTSRP